MTPTQAAVDELITAFCDWDRIAGKPPLGSDGKPRQLTETEGAIRLAAETRRLHAACAALEISATGLHEMVAAARIGQEPAVRPMPVGDAVLAALLALRPDLDLQEAS